MHYKLYVKEVYFTKDHMATTKWSYDSYDYMTACDYMITRLHDHMTAEPHDYMVIRLYYYKTSWSHLVIGIILKVLVIK